MQNCTKGAFNDAKHHRTMDTFGLPSIPSGGMAGVQTFIDSEEGARSDLEGCEAALIIEDRRGVWGPVAAIHILTKDNTSIAYIEETYAGP